jgi:hypothetical protein
MVGNRPAQEGGRQMKTGRPKTTRVRRHKAPAAEENVADGLIHAMRARAARFAIL